MNNDEVAENEVANEMIAENEVANEMIAENEVAMDELIIEPEIKVSIESEIKPNIELSIEPIIIARHVERCMICTDDMIESDDIHFLQCFHRFHIKCISRWLTVKAQCPICKFPANIDIIGVDENGKFISASGHIINNGVIQQSEDEDMNTRIGRAIDLLRTLHEHPPRRRMNLNINTNDMMVDHSDSNQNDEEHSNNAISNSDNIQHNLDEHISNEDAGGEGNSSQEFEDAYMQPIRFSLGRSVRGAMSEISGLNRISGMNETSNQNGMETLGTRRINRLMTRRGAITDNTIDLSYNNAANNVANNAANENYYYDNFQNNNTNAETRWRLPMHFSPFRPFGNIAYEYKEGTESQDSDMPDLIENDSINYPSDDNSQQNIIRTYSPIPDPAFAENRNSQDSQYDSKNYEYYQISSPQTETEESYTTQDQEWVNNVFTESSWNNLQETPLLSHDPWRDFINSENIRINWNTHDVKSSNNVDNNADNNIVIDASGNAEINSNNDEGVHVANLNNAVNNEQLSFNYDSSESESSHQDSEYEYSSDSDELY